MEKNWHLCYGTHLSIIDSLSWKRYVLICRVTKIVSVKNISCYKKEKAFNRWKNIRRFVVSCSKKILMISNYLLGSRLTKNNSSVYVMSSNNYTTTSHLTGSQDTAIHIYACTVSEHRVNGAMQTQCPGEPETRKQYKHTEVYRTTMTRLRHKHLCSATINVLEGVFKRYHTVVTCRPVFSCPIECRSLYPGQQYRLHIKNTGFICFVYVSCSTAFYKSEAYKNIFFGDDLLDF